MQTAKVLIHINGEPFNVVEKPLTAPEIVIIRRLHGADSVQDPVRIEDRATSNGDELNRLREVYGDAIVTECFPGAMPQLPATLSAVGIATEEPEVKPVAKAAKTVSSKEA